MLSDKQIEERRSFLGGSDAAGILGISPFMTPLKVWQSKVEGKEFVYADQERLLWGSLSEPMIAQEFGRRLAMRVEDPDKAYRHINYSYLGGNPDRFIYSLTETNGKGPGILEIKTANPFVYKLWKNDKGEFEIPDYYYAQLQHYLMITGLKWGYFAVLIGNEKMDTYYYDRDDKFIKIMSEVEIHFWKNYIEKKVQPPLTEYDNLLEHYRKARNESPIPATPQVFETYNELTVVRGSIKDLEEKEDKLKKRIQLFMGENDSLRYDGAQLCTWKNVASNKFDTKRFKVVHPKYYKQYLNEGSTRRFLVK